MSLAVDFMLSYWVGYLVLQGLLALADRFLFRESVGESG